jgi:hypothetical protein
MMNGTSHGKTSQGLKIAMSALPRPLPTMIRNWARAYGTEDLQASLAALEDAIRTQQARR